MSELVDIIVEWIAGAPQRYELDEGTGAVHPVHEPDKHPPPEHYGCVPGALTAADGELLDVLLLCGGPRAPGERVGARIIGVLRRSDGDNKLVAVDPQHSDLTDVAQVDAERLRLMRRWFQRQHVLLGWSGPDAARTVLDDARRVWQLAHERG